MCNIVIAGVQMKSEIGKLDNNINTAIKSVEIAISKGAQIICLPELFNTGYFCHNDSNCNNKYFDLAEPLDGRTISTFREIAAKNKVEIITPIFEKDLEGIYYNTAVILDSNGNILGSFRKLHIPWGAQNWEKYYFRPGKTLPIFDLSYVKIGVLICYDRHYPEAFRILALKGAQIIFVPTGSYSGSINSWLPVLQTRAIENQLFIIGVGLTGKVAENSFSFLGQTAVFNPNGEILGRLEQEESILICELDLGQIKTARQERQIFRDWRPEIYYEIYNRGRNHQ